MTGSEDPPAPGTHVRKPQVGLPSSLLPVALSLARGGALSDSERGLSPLGMTQSRF